ncbi:ATP-dependent DNA helicase RecG [hydrothermal vent metagenome]|uniref:ATP-dependent DNA helicase RecG n=1 Tax=hydrothermal vent metagenome TaxID=652676 RepID=A0A1W1BJJ1_9ZZZZ
MEKPKEIATKFKKLGISSWCELALHIPHHYEDFRLHQQIKPNQNQLIDATIESLSKTPNTLQISFYVHNFGVKMMGVIFKPKKYMFHQFQVGMRDFFYGHIECKGGFCSMKMPKKITKIGAITPKYKSALRNDVMLRFIQTYLTPQNLASEGLKQEIIDEILQFHFPQNGVINLQNIPKKSLESLKYLELFIYMKKLQAKKKYFPALKKITGSYDAFVKSLPFTLTKEQLLAIQDIQKDFSRDIATKRMVVGDVGSGKTMVILASAFMNRENRTILMAPTTILANQLFEEAQKFLPQIKSILVTNKTKKIDLASYSFIIGTHALLYRELPQATLVMVDEQHRFGTQQRNMLEKLVTKSALKPHYIQFSATPIPRTQAMIETAHIDVSLITSTPFQKDITSKVIHKSDFKDLLLHIKAEIEKNNQVLIVYPLVEQSDTLAYQSIEEARGYWEKNFQDVYVTHGKDKEKEKVLLEFREKGKILLATTVVEVGISLPRLSTVVIVGAERLGLSTLHQLRGRVSRTGLKGYCYLYTNQIKSPRLEQFAKTTSGFDIANLDLQFRKSGDLLKGTQQSGSEFVWVDLAVDEKIVQEVKRDIFNK